MSENNVILPKARGFAGLIERIMMPLNENPVFKEKFKKTKKTFVINASNLNFAAIVYIKEGTIAVKSIANKPKSNLKKKVVGWDGFISMDSQIFIALAMDRMSIIQVGIKYLTRKVKMRGILKLLTFLKIMDMLK